MYQGEETGSILGPTSNPRASLFSADPAWTALTGPARLSFGFSGDGDIVGGPWHPFDDAYGEDAYLGFEFGAEDGTHYGWIRIHEFAGVGGFFREYAYNDTPGESILAGQIPEPDILPLLALAFAGIVMNRKRRMPLGN